jgi:bifunctional DNA-binding transcriptional regulator/antitoxin component of YhaV-PrlF toxin-antitoxin module
MKAFELPVKVDAEGRIELPASLARLLEQDPSARMILLIEEDGEAVWSKAASEAFLVGYADTDSVYDTID